jgi:hypothetical protein
VSKESNASNTASDVLIWCKDTRVVGGRGVGKNNLLLPFIKPWQCSRYLRGLVIEGHVARTGMLKKGTHHFGCKTSRESKTNCRIQVNTYNMYPTRVTGKYFVTSRTVQLYKYWSLFWLPTTVSKCDTSQSNHQWRKRAIIVESAHCQQYRAQEGVRETVWNYSVDYLYEAHLSDSPNMGRRHERNGMLACVLIHKWLHFVDTAIELTFP